MQLTNDTTKYMWFYSYLIFRRSDPGLLRSSHRGIPKSLDIRLAMGVNIDVTATVERRPLGLFLEETHSFDVLYIISNHQP